MRLALAFVSLFALQFAADAYVLKHGNISRMTTSNLLEDEPVVAKLFDSNQDFFWIRYQGADYVVRDAATLAAIEDAYAPVRALASQKQSVKSRAKALRQRARSIDDMLAIEDDAATRAKLERNRDDVQRELRVAEAEQQRAIERRERASREGDEKMMAIFQRALRSGLAEKQR
ncbi:MAG TPA: hypothetical protein VMU84_03520 [Thermoanaerobaculia bacterium]|nr:hypothetical protein [Thermoanaerobaculia bacterium]